MEKILFSTRDIVAKYPNNIGLQKSLRQYLNQVKIRSVKTGTIKCSGFGPNIRYSLFDAVKIKESIESYISEYSYRINKERREDLKTILELVKEKIEKEMSK